MKKTTRQFSWMMFFGFASYTMMTNQIIPFLTHLGYSPTQRGWVLSLMSITAILGQIILGYLSDHMKTMKRLFIYISVMMAISGVLSFWFTSSHFIYYLLILGVGAGIARTALNFIEAWVMEVDGMQSQFGFIRSFGSLGWASFSLIAGFMITKLGYPSLAVLIAIFTFIVIALASKTQDASKSLTEKVDFKDVGLLFKNYNFVMLIVIYFIAYVSYNADSITLTDYMIELGASEALIGMKWFIQAVFEIPTMMITYHLMKRIGAKAIMAIGCFVLMFRLGVSSYVGNNTFTIIISSLQMFSYPFILLSQKDLVFKEIPNHLKSSGQLIAISFSVALGGALTPILSGVLVERFGTQMTLYLFALMMLIPIALLTTLKDSKTV